MSANLYTVNCNIVLSYIIDIKEVSIPYSYFMV